ncbi:putative outer membrane starch-binding protein [Sunxiuqinia elliptica]|uniref:Putative outer membrane starch-binding protein n=2 Tax=Sunxiuqinia elliptica TaxID=655355 RepID=A0A4R6GMC3_9BACT|nr:putative outer membrane starch-binding protein [Sunxiuqinia elliptica]TDO68063.1 putative outer membrane starch-binding protein [Sunxiuqinia elliptica]
MMQITFGNTEKNKNYKLMKTKYIIAIVLSLLITTQSCDLEMEEYNKITPDNFYNTEKDAKLAIAALYYNSITKVGTWSPGLFVQNINSVLTLSDIAAGDMMTCSYGTNPWEYLRTHQWTESNGYGTQNVFKYYNHISNARIVANQIEKMDISENLKAGLIAEAKAVGAWKAAILYDYYGPVPYPTDEMLATPAELVYPERPSKEDFVKIIESLFDGKDALPEADYGPNFGRINKSIANMVLLRLYMNEAARTGDVNFWNKAKDCAEQIISSGSHELQNSYSDVFSVNNTKNNEIIFATPSDYSFNTMMWHAESLPNNFPLPGGGSSNSWGGYKILWSFYDTFDANDQRLSGIAASYTTSSGVEITRENPVDNRHGLGDGAIPVKYDLDPNQVSFFQGHDFIVYRYAEVLLAMAEILNELQTTADANAPVIAQVSKDGVTYTSDGGNTAYSFINAIRVRAGLEPLTTMSKEALRDAILMERSHELYCEGTRRMDLIRYQRMTDGNGYKKFDDDENKFLFPIPVNFINEYKGNLTQNPGY